jgi:anaphase-promoting complex subunit 2
MRKLRWMNALGSGSITLTFDDRTEEFDNLTPWQVSVVHAFQPQEGEEHIATRISKGGEGITRNIEQLEELLDMDESLVRQATAFWTGKSVLRATGPDTYAIIERLPSSTAVSSTDATAARAAEERAALEEAAQPAAVKTQADLLEEKKGVYNAFIVGMLTAQGNMPVARIAMMMRMMVQGGFPFGEKEVGDLLSGLEDEGKVVALGGGTWGVRK